MIFGALSAKSKKVWMLLEESANRNIFVQVGPMNADAAADQPPVLSFPGEAALRMGNQSRGTMISRPSLSLTQIFSLEKRTSTALAWAVL